MRVKIDPNNVTLWASANDTSAWAARPGAHWPASTLAGRNFRADFDANGLYDLTVDGASFDAEGVYPHGDVDGHELSIICSDLLATRLPTDHPAYPVAVGQFKED